MGPYVKRRDTSLVDDGWTVSECHTGKLLAVVDTETMANAVIHFLIEGGAPPDCPAGVRVGAGTLADCLGGVVPHFLPGRCCSMTACELVLADSYAGHDQVCRELDIVSVAPHDHTNKLTVRVTDRAGNVAEGAEWEDGEFSWREAVAPAKSKKE